MKTELIIQLREKYSDMRLRSIDKNDIEDIRIWKNINCNRFFYNEEIDLKEQILWYMKYKDYKGNYIFIAEINIENIWVKFGCLGFRIMSDRVDLYNIIRSTQIEKNGSMKNAMAILLQYINAIGQDEIKCDVLKNNPAVGWYKKCGFQIEKETDNYYVMKYVYDIEYSNKSNQL